MPWTISSERSVYLQLIDIIKHKILSGEYPPGSRIPSVRELAVDAAVNPNTMQRAMLELERDGLINTQRTNGRFITEDTELIDNTRTELAANETILFLQKLKELGLTKEAIQALIAKLLKEE